LAPVKKPKSTTAHPGYPVSGPPAAEGQPGPTPMPLLGPTPGGPGPGAVFPAPPGTGTHSQPLHPHTGKHEHTHSQPKHPAER